jgi:hypothetical protein
MNKKKSKKVAKDKLPKTIAGVKVPKELRKGGQFARFMSDPIIREIALAALAAGLAARKDARQAAKSAVRDVGEAAEDAAEEVGRGAGWVKAALGAAALEAGRMVIDAIEETGARAKSGGSSGQGKQSANGQGRQAGAEAEGGAR